ncbi:signal recognition particle-docking protein FtsY [Mesorhizobium sp. KR2-14]|uniref:signal recognition particle-docking protein FtsY n=1 Tax=Mesorhizobium sp. KR2-14 TaxID=3156610 RepID=UPI0032B324EA
MAFGFIKKVFSFGKKPGEEAAPEAEAPITEALEQLTHETEAPVEKAPSEEAVPGPQEPAPTPQPDEPAPAPTPAEPEPAPVVPEPAPAEIPEPPQEVPTQPAEQPGTSPIEIPGSVLQQPEPVSKFIEVPAEPSTPPQEPTGELPPAEILPPLRQPSPVEIDPLRDEVAPEIAAIEPPVSQAVQPHAVAALAEAPKSPASGAAALAAGKVTVARKVEEKAQPAAPAAPEPRSSWFQRLRQGLSRSSKELSSSIAGVFTKRKLDEDTLEELEEVLIRADLGMETAIRITDALSSSRYGKDVSDTEVRTIMAEQVEKVLKPVAMPLELDLSHKPHVILVVGVNGTGKTTTIGKLAAKLTEGGLSVMLAAGDTFRAAAIEQLKIWGERTGSPVVSSKLGADAAGLAYDAFEKAKAAGSDVLIIDTAGRLQNKAELMAELEKIVRVLGKLDPEAPHTVLQTVDATTGQNALNQVEIFRNIAGVNGLVMTKLDGTARGGILVAIAAKHRLPVYFIGVGEQVDDLEPFSAGDFAKAIAGVA